MRELTPLSQAEFRELAFDVMGEILQSVMRWSVYQAAVAKRLDEVLAEVQIRVTFGDFFKLYPD
jgi:hypothetical protein